MFVAGCASGARTVEDLLATVRKYDEELIESIKYGLAKFDEHNLRADTAAIEQEIASRRNDELPPFRVYNEATRAASSVPARLGLIVFNLGAKRIVQVQNSYSEIRRQDRGRVRRSGQPIRALYHYSLPNEWTILP